MKDLNALVERLAEAEVARERATAEAETAVTRSDAAAVAAVEARAALDDAVLEESARHRLRLRGPR